MAIILEAGQIKEVNVSLEPRGLDPDPPDDDWPHGYFTLYGYVTQYDTGAPIEGASVCAGGYNGCVKTDANGYYVHRRCIDLRHLCPDGWGVTCDHPHYRQGYETVYHAAGEIVQLDWRLIRS